MSDDMWSDTTLMAARAAGLKRAEERCWHTRQCGCQLREVQRVMGVLATLQAAGWTFKPPRAQQ